uniref:40S ribosomal protein S15 n=1 Tax=Glossina pallidipes TaxID=7398 RepID=A0A1A9Z1V6_GLOPL
MRFEEEITTRIDTKEIIGYLAKEIMPNAARFLYLITTRETIQNEEVVKKKRAFKKFTYRGVVLDLLLDMPKKVVIICNRARRSFFRDLKRKPMALIKKLRKAKKEAPPNEKPEIVKTYLRNMIVVPEMTGSIIGVYDSKNFGQVEIKGEMIVHYLERTLTYQVHEKVSC